MLKTMEERDFSIVASWTGKCEESFTSNLVARWRWKILCLQLRMAFFKPLLMLLSHYSLLNIDKGWNSIIVSSGWSKWKTNKEGLKCKSSMLFLKRTYIFQNVHDSKDVNKHCWRWIFALIKMCTWGWNIQMKNQKDR